MTVSPVYLIASMLGVALVVWLLKQNWSEVPQSYSFKATATHMRMRPFTNKFKTDFHYVLYKLRDSPTQGEQSLQGPSKSQSESILFREANKGFAVLRVYPRMFLSEGYSSSGMSIL